MLGLVRLHEAAAHFRALLIRLSQGVRLVGYRSESTPSLARASEAVKCSTGMRTSRDPRAGRTGLRRVAAASRLVGAVHVAVLFRSLASEGTPL